MAERSPTNSSNESQAKSNAFVDQEVYAAELNQGLAVSGEDSTYFARGRLQFLRERLEKHGKRASSVLDFGCGNGSTAPLLHQLLGAEQVVGVDASRELLTEAKKCFGSASTQFAAIDMLPNKPQFNLVYCNGVFHHIRPDDRASALRSIYDHLLPGGLFSFWENNPWNPGTRWIMSRIEFDKDAITISPSAAPALLRKAGFEILETQYAFFFPRALRWLRGIEPHLKSFPLGAQYLVLAKKPAS